VTQRPVVKISATPMMMRNKVSFSIHRTAIDCAAIGSALSGLAVVRRWIFGNRVQPVGSWLVTL
jgi:hypothetical protein